LFNSPDYLIIMDDLCFKIDIVLNECSRYLCNIEKKEFDESFYKIIFKVSEQQNILRSSVLINCYEYIITYRI